MQAIFIFAMYGMFFAIIAGLVGHLSLSTQNLITRQIEDTERFFSEVALFYQEYVVQKNVRVPSQAPINYLRLNGVKQGVNWPWSGGDTRYDPWNNEFLVKAVHEFHAIRGDAGNTVQPRATAMVLVSAGPDRQFHQGLINRINNANTINRIMNLEASNNTDDIVYTFNTRRALEKRWQVVESAVNNLAATISYQYQQEFQNTTFQNQSQIFYNWAINNDVNFGARTTDLWKRARSFGYPNWSSLRSVAPNLNSYENQINNMTWRDNQTAYLIESNFANEGQRSTRLNLVATAGSSLSTMMVSDQLTIGLNEPTNSAWGNAAGNFNFSVTVGQ